MKKFIPVIVVAVVLLLVLVVVMSRKSAGVVDKAKPSVRAATTVEIQKKNKSAALMKEAQAAYDAKNYQKAIDKTQEVLGSVDNMSQEAKNLLQISQIRTMEQAQAPVAQEPVPMAEEPVPMAEEPAK